MAYTVKKLAAISGVSVRTLHWYDEVGLLKPAYHGANGYRFYEEAQLLMLQQILFYRELGFELNHTSSENQRRKGGSAALRHASTIAPMPTGFRPATALLGLREVETCLV